MSDELVISVPEAARRLGVSDWLLYREIKADRFPHRRIGARIVVPLHALEQWAENDQSTTAS